MPLNLQLQALSVPSGTEFPGTVQELLDLIAQYEQISGGESFSGVTYGDAEPSPEDRGLAWFRTDGGGNPIGWYGWNGSSWTLLPQVVPSGPTASRPSPATQGQQFYDTTIKASLIFISGVWTTVDGVPGDIKFVAGTVLADVLAKNPGWSHYTDGIGRVLSGAEADGSDAETDAGTDQIVLTTTQMPEHIHPDLIVTGSDADNGDNGGFTIMANTASIGTKTVTNSQTGPAGGTDPVDVRQSTRYLFCLRKD